MQLRLTKRTLLATCAAALIVSGGAGAALSAPEFGYHTNPSGQTYGKAPLNHPDASQGDFPDLVAVVGDHGTEGYVRSDQLDDPSLDPTGKTPAQVLAAQAKAQDRALPVFAADGKTKVDTFTVAAPTDDGVTIPPDPDAVRSAPQ